MGGQAANKPLGGQSDGHDMGDLAVLGASQAGHQPLFSLLPCWSLPVLRQRGRALWLAVGTVGT